MGLGKCFRGETNGSSLGFNAGRQASQYSAARLVFRRRTRLNSPLAEMNRFAMLTIYHNPRCSKSREALALLQEHAQAHDDRITVIEYLKTPPTRAELAELRRRLGCPAADMVRKNEDEFAALGLAGASDDALLDALAAHPKLLQRPIVVTEDGRALIARPPELLLAFLG